MAHQTQDISDHHAGDAMDIVVTVQDDQGSTIDITGATAIEWLLKENASDTDGNALLTKDMAGGGISITDGANGEFTVTLDTGDTTGMSGTKHHRARFTDADSDRTTIFTGSFTIEV